MALLGKSSEELFITALRGCNQHKHKPGCPDADGEGDNKKGGSWAERWRAKTDEEKLAAYEAGLKKALETARSTGNFAAWDSVRTYRRRIASIKKKIANA